MHFFACEIIKKTVCLVDWKDVLDMDAKKMIQRKIAYICKRFGSEIKCKNIKNQDFF